jgi:hypothetical protein
MSLVYCKLRPRLAPVNLTKQTNVTKERVGGASFPSRSLSDNFTITFNHPIVFLYLPQTL